jgi:hypothetical protein
MKKRTLPLFPPMAIVLFLLLVLFRNSSAALWIAMSALIGASLWTFHTARRSWSELLSGKASRLQRLGEFVHYCFLSLAALAMVATAIMRRAGINTTPVAVLFAALFVTEFVARVAIQIKLARSEQGGQKPSKAKA